jgi:hypothetical protein
MKKECPENVTKCPEIVHVIQKMSGKYPANDQIHCPEFFICRKTGKIPDMKNFGQIKLDMKKFWTNLKNSGHEKILGILQTIFSKIEKLKIKKT